MTQPFGTGPIDDEQQRQDITKLVRNIVGFVLIAIGLAIILWTFFQIYGIFKDPAVLDNFAKILPVDDHLRQIQIDEQKIILPPLLFQVIIYALVVVMFCVLVAIGSALITPGASLLQPDITKFLAKAERYFARQRQRQNTSE